MGTPESEVAMNPASEKSEEVVEEAKVEVEEVAEKLKAPKREQRKKQLTKNLSLIQKPLFRGFFILKQYEFHKRIIGLQSN